VQKDANEVIALLVHAVHMQHSAIDNLIARLCVYSPVFRPSQSGEIWDAVKDGHTALQAWSSWAAKGDKA